MNPQSSPPAALARCKSCNSLMSLLLQLNGDLPSQFPDDERRLHIFCCRRSKCTRKPGSVRALREVKRFKSKRRLPLEEDEDRKISASGPRDPTVNLGAALFGATKCPPMPSNANSFSTTTSITPSSNPFAPLPPSSTLAAKPPQSSVDNVEPPTDTFASKLRIAHPTTPERGLSEGERWPEQSAFPRPFPHLYLDADYESLIREQPVQANSSVSNPKYTEDESAPSGLEKDSFESSLDKVFLRFSDRLAQNPEQVLRYEFRGSPLLYSGNDGVAVRFGQVPGKSKQPIGIPRCETCGAQRVFELQLVPGAIDALEEGSMDLGEGMEWGTIILGVCSNDCAEVGEVVYREEWVGVQWEERIPER